MSRVQANAERGSEGGVLVELHTQNSEHTYALRENAARRLLIDLIHATDIEIPDDD